MSDPKSPFSDEALRDQARKLEQIPTQTGKVGVVVDGGDVGVAGEVHIDVGKPGGFFVAAEGSWMKKAGEEVRRDAWLERFVRFGRPVEAEKS